jgi:dynein heavy chain
VTLVKPRAAAVSATAPGADVVVCELPAEPLEGLRLALSDVFLPLLANPANQAGWGEVAAREVLDRLHALLANVTIAVGQTRGETCLPLPPLAALGNSGGGGGGGGVAAAAAAPVSAKDRTHQLEGAVLVWTKQLKVVLRADPEALLRAGAHPGPDAEVAFWKAKAGNLNAIFAQLQSERIRRVLQFLDTAESNFCTVRRARARRAASTRSAAPPPPRCRLLRRAPPRAALCAAVQGSVCGAARGQRQRQVPAAAGGVLCAAGRRRRRCQQRRRRRRL